MSTLLECEFCLEVGAFVVQGRPRLTADTILFLKDEFRRRGRPDPVFFVLTVNSNEAFYGALRDSGVVAAHENVFIVSAIPLPSSESRPDVPFGMVG